MKDKLQYFSTAIRVACCFFLNGCVLKLYTVTVACPTLYMTTTLEFYFPPKNPNFIMKRSVRITKRNRFLPTYIK